MNALSTASDSDAAAGAGAGAGPGEGAGEAAGVNAGAGAGAGAPPATPRVGRLRAARSLPPGGPEKAGPAANAARPAEN